MVDAFLQTTHSILGWDLLRPDLVTYLEIGCDVLTHQKWYVSVDHPLDASPTEYLFQERRKLHRRDPQRRLGRLVKHVGDWW